MLIYFDVNMCISYRINLRQVYLFYITHIYKPNPLEIMTQITQIDRLQEYSKTRLNQEYKSCINHKDGYFPQKFQFSIREVYVWDLIYKKRKFEILQDNRYLNSNQSISLSIYFNKWYPLLPPCVKFNKQVEHTKITQQGNKICYLGVMVCNLLGKFWSLNIPMVLVLKEIVQIIESKEFKIIKINPFVVEHGRARDEEERELLQTGDTLSSHQNVVEKHKKNSAKSTTTETKNLNRHFRSKLRQILREKMKQNTNDSRVVELYNFFKPNRVGFKEIRIALSLDWFNEILRQQLRNGEFLRRILNSIMNIESKNLMLKYYPIIEQAILSPREFSRWKY